jgi:hypothetical protein
VRDNLKNEKTAKSGVCPRGFNDCACKTMAKQKLEFIAVGSKGTAGVLCEIPDTLNIAKPLNMVWPDTSASGSSNLAVCIAHSKGKPSGFLAYDLVCAVSERGENFRVYPLSDAVKNGIVVQKQVTIERDGKTVRGNGYFLPKHSKAEKQPRMLAVDCIPALRIEPLGKVVSSDKRNASLLWKLVLTPKAGASKPKANKPKVRKPKATPATPTPATP